MSPPFPSTAVLALALAGAGALSGQTLSTKSPFSPASAPANASAGQEAPMKLVGVSKIGKDTLVCLRLPTGKSAWIKVGTQVEGLGVLSYDPVKQETIVQVGKTTHLLSLANVSTLKAAPAQPAPPKASPPAIPDVGPAGGKLPPVTPLVTREEQEREARMFLTDIMEIGMRQRKAYAEAKRKADEEAARKPRQP